MSFRKSAAAIAFIAFVITPLSGCMTIGNNFDVAAAHRLVVGQSTMDDAIRDLGTPTARSAMANNNTLLQWQFTMGTMVGGHAKHIALLFDGNGRFAKITHEYQQ